MDKRIETALSRFLRTYDSPFTAKDINSILKSFGQKVEREEITEFLDSDDRVFPLKNRYYLTKSAAFTGMFFSFLPTQQELDQQLFVPGDRCMPFVDGEILSCHLTFVYQKKVLPSKIMNADCILARDLFTFYGDEYSSQYISADPANKDLCIANNNFELPPKLRLTGVSLESVFKKKPLKKGDRILCRVIDWDQAVIEIIPVYNEDKNVFVLNSEAEDKENWIKELEDALFECFSNMGPCASMEQQLSYAFYAHRRELCNSECASIHEFLKESKRIGMELFGVETRLWKKGENVPAVGDWNREYIKAGLEGAIPIFHAPECLIDCLIKDQFFEKKDDVEQIIDRLMPDSMQLSPEEKDFFTLQIMRRNAILRRHYNWFADFAIGTLRHKALQLYSRVEELICDIDCAGEQIEKFPQQELVTLSQLFTHVSRILEMLTSGPECADEEKTALKLSLEGMECNFEDIRTELKIAVEKFKAGQFKVI